MLLHVLRLPVKETTGANTVIGLPVVVSSVVRRWSQQQLTTDDYTLGAVKAVASISGATLGAMQAHRLCIQRLQEVICLYLLIVGVWMVIEGLAKTDHSFVESTGWPRWILGALVGFLIAVFGAGLGVAGGEMRIPAPMYLFAVPVKEAGTISLLASIPALAAEAFTYRNLGPHP